MAEQEWQITITRGEETIQKKIKLKQEKIKKLPAKVKDKLDLVLEGIKDVKKTLKENQGKKDK